MKIIACGCSFMAVDKKAQGTHFTEIIANQLRGDLKSYAKMGASNFVIRLQVEEALRQNPSLILIGFTSSDRIEISNSKFELGKGIRNIQYSSAHKLPEFFNNLAGTVSAPITNFLLNPVHLDEKIDSEKLNALKYWTTNLYDSQIKTQSDFYIVQSALYLLEKSKIPFIFTRGGLTGFSYDEWTNFEIDCAIGNPWLFVNHSDPMGSDIYHTTFHKQKELASVWLNKLTLFETKYK